MARASARAVWCAVTSVEVTDKIVRSPKSVIAKCAAAGPRSAAKPISTGTKFFATAARTASARSAFGICPASKTTVTSAP